VAIGIDTFFLCRLTKKDNTYRYMVKRKPLMTIGIKEISEEDYNHFFHKWLYTYGGASDVKTLKDFIEEYDSDWYGEVNVYNSSVCPCVMCMDKDIE